MTHHVGVLPSRPKACHATLLVFFVDNDFWSTSSTVPSHLRFILDSESRQVIFFFLPTYPPLTIGRVGSSARILIGPSPWRLAHPTSHLHPPEHHHGQYSYVSTMKTDEMCVVWFGIPTLTLGRLILRLHFYFFRGGRVFVHFSPIYPW